MKEVKSYKADRDFLSKFLSVYELVEGNSALLVTPDFQGRVMTSTYDIVNGRSFGWINYDLIQSKKIEPHINAYGGEERFWIGPEGGQYSIYFKQGKDFSFDNWQVPKELDTLPFRLVKKEKNILSFEQEINLNNYIGTSLPLKINRDVKILSKEEIEMQLGISVGHLQFVGYQTRNEILNIGTSAWKKETGLLNIWLLGMFAPSDDMQILIPITNKEGITTDYFGTIPTDRLCISSNCIRMRADGKYRSKIGVTPQSATNCIASYSAEKNELTIVVYQKPKREGVYLNAKWEYQENLFCGDVINAYNDGKLANGKQMGPFYELETSSTTAELNSNESIEHIQNTYHFKADIYTLQQVAKQILKIDL